MTYFKKILKFIFGLFVVIIINVFILNLFIIFFVESSDIPNSVQEKTINGEIIRYQTWEGSGDTAVLLVGGLSAWSETWKSTVLAQQQLGNTQTFIAVDLPPFGYSVPNLGKGFTRDIQADRLKNFIAELEYEKIILVGHSYGGGPIAEVAMANLPQVIGTILISPVLLLDVEEEQKAPFWLTENFLLKSIVRPILYADFLLLQQFKSFVFIKDNVTYELLSVYTKPLIYPATNKKLISWLVDFTAEPIHKLPSTKKESYGSINTPLILMWGDKDNLTPITDADHISGFENVFLHTLEDIGHIPMIEDPSYFSTEFYTSLNSMLK